MTEATPPPSVPHPRPQLMNNLDFKNAVDELKQAVDYLQATGSPKVGAPRVSGQPGPAREGHAS